MSRRKRSSRHWNGGRQRMPDAPAITSWVIARYYCPSCRKVLAVVKHPEVTELRCPKCHGLTVETCGHDRTEEICQPG